MTPTTPTAVKAPVTPTSILMSEHRVIEKALACLERMAAEFEEKATVEAPVAGEALEFLRTFADRCHHGKEETNLFPAMEARGLPADVGPTEMMRQEHATGRAFIRDMAEAVADANAGAFVTGARGYVALLREHIVKEDEVLFPMADGLLPQGDQDRLRREFERIEAVDIGRDRVAALLASVEDLCTRYGVVETPRPAGTKCGRCCGH